MLESPAQDQLFLVLLMLSMAVGPPPCSQEGCSPRSESIPFCAMPLRQTALTKMAQGRGKWSLKCSHKEVNCLYFWACCHCCPLSLPSLSWDPVARGEGSHENEEVLGRWRSESRPCWLIWAKRGFGPEEGVVMWSGSVGTQIVLVAVGQPGEPVPGAGSLAWRHLLSCCTSLLLCFHLLLPVIVMKVPLHFLSCDFSQE